MIKFLLLFVSLSLFAQMPDYLKDGIVTVQLTDGSTYTFSSNEYKVVPRDSVVTSNPDTGSEVINEVVYVQNERKSTLKFYIGYAPYGLITSASPVASIIEQDYKVVIGIGYDYRFSNRFSLGVLGLSNSTFAVNFGINY